MVKKNLKITEFEDKTSMGGMPYTRFKSQDGWASCFDAAQISMLKKLTGSLVSCEVSEVNKNGLLYMNIKKCYGTADAEACIESQITKDFKAKAPVEMNASRNATMYVSYAKDLIVAGFKAKDAVEAIKELKKAFEGD